MKFGLQNRRPAAPNFGANIQKCIREKNGRIKRKKKLANNDLNMIARTIKNQLLLVSCSCFNEKPNSEFLRII